MSELLKINVSEHTEKKNGLTYLSWAWAWSEVLKIDPTATWIAHEYGPDGCNIPFMRLPDETAMVKVSVMLNGNSKTCLLPVMDHRNKAIPNPNAFQVNTALMRCLAKAISMHGLGLYIYAGEDLPEDAEATDKPKLSVVTPALPPVDVDQETKVYLQELAMDLIGFVKAGTPQLAYEQIEAENLDGEQKIALWSMLDSRTRSAIKLAKTSPQLG